ncbi:hypothetical protein ACFS07_22645 [Undibacterium arcticum]
MAGQSRPGRIFDACAQLGLDAFVGKLHLTPRPGKESTGINPAQAVILQLMDMVRKKMPTCRRSRRC